MNTKEFIVELKKLCRDIDKTAADPYVKGFSVDYVRNLSNIVKGWVAVYESDPNNLTDGYVFGKVKWFNDAKGFGYISDTSGKEYFTHHEHIMSAGYKTLKEDEIVKFFPTEDSGGLPVAHGVIRMCEEFQK